MQPLRYLDSSFRVDSLLILLDSLLYDFLNRLAPFDVPRHAADEAFTGVCNGYPRPGLALQRFAAAHLVHLLLDVFCHSNLV